MKLQVSVIMILRSEPSKNDVRYMYAQTPTMEYYSAIKRNEVMPFAATWMALDIIILSEVNQTV